ncbi:hypothetical protein AAY473_014002 [Plecturocebus cupreus]
MPLEGAEQPLQEVQAKATQSQPAAHRTGSHEKPADHILTLNMQLKRKGAGDPPALPYSCSEWLVERLGWLEPRPKVIWLLPMPVATWAMCSLVLRAWALSAFSHSSSLRRATSCFDFSLTLMPSLVLAISVNVLEVLQGLDGEDVLTALLGHTLRACLDEVVQQCQCLVHMPPVLAVVTELLPHHAHDLQEGHHIVDSAHLPGYSEIQICDMRLLSTSLVTSICLITRDREASQQFQADVKAHISVPNASAPPRFTSCQGRGTLLWSFLFERSLTLSPCGTILAHCNFRLSGSSGSPASASQGTHIVRMVFLYLDQAAVGERIGAELGGGRQKDD